MLSEAEFRVLSHRHDEQSVSELAEKLPRFKRLRCSAR